MIRELESLADNPFALLRAMGDRLRLADRGASGASEEVQWTGLGFRIGETWMVVPRDEVREVMPLPTLTSVPGARSWLMGVANLRGNLLPVTLLADLVGAVHGADKRERRVVVLNSPTVPAGFLVDEVAGYRRFSPADQRHELARDAHPWTPYLLGAFAREGQVWLVLSLRKLVYSDTFVHAAE